MIRILGRAASVNQDGSCESAPAARFRQLTNAGDGIVVHNGLFFRPIRGAGRDTPTRHDAAYGVVIGKGVRLTQTDWPEEFWAATR